ncbi:MAG: DUF4286 family protein [Muribaculaceae bacterium]|nr:DUF4286 family protein [Muribaculaceae bacterium]
MEYIHNTTFIVERSVADDFISWARNVYIPAAERSGHFRDITMAKILAEIDPAAINFCIQMRSESLSSSEQWHCDTALILKDDIAARLGAERVMFFSTDMEIIK